MFVAGQAVICVSSDHPKLVRGKKYIISSYEDGYTGRGIVTVVGIYSIYDSRPIQFYSTRFKSTNKEKVTTYAVIIPKYFGFATGYLRVTKERTDYTQDLHKISRKKNDCTLFLSKGAAVTWAAAHNVNNFELMPVLKTLTV
jgi:hypothetical protein